MFVAGADGADCEPASFLDLFPRVFIELLCAVLRPAQHGLSTVTELKGRIWEGYG